MTLQTANQIALILAQLLMAVALVHAGRAFRNMFQEYQHMVRAFQALTTLIAAQRQAYTDILALADRALKTAQAKEGAK